MVSPNAHLCRLSVYEPGRPIEEVAREYGLDPSTVVKLASNENSLGPSPRALEAIRKASLHAHVYPDGNAFRLRQAIAHRHGLKIEQVVVGNGSNEIIEFLGHAYLAPGIEMVISQYAFAIYESVGRLFRAEVVEVPAKEYGHHLEAMRAAITARTRLVFVANPNNPTGTSVQASALREFIRGVPSSTLVVIDEAYHEFLKDALETPSLIQECPNLVVMRTFSKALGLAGLRIGYGLASMEVAAALQKVRQPFQANVLAQEAALAALSDEEHLRKSVCMVEEGRAFLESACRARRLEFIPSSANFVLIRTGDGRGIFEKLQSRGIIVRPMQSYKLPDWIRVTVGTPTENQRFMDALTEIMAP